MNKPETNASRDMPQLFIVLFFFFNQWNSAFRRKDVFHRALELAIASLLCLGRKTVTSMAIFLKRSSVVPVGDYKFFSDRKWVADDLFRPILAESVKHIPDDYITIGVDDTRLAKTGKKIPYTNWGRDPLGPPFQTNLIWGLRELHFSIILPLYGKKPQIVNDNDKQEEASSLSEKPTPSRAIPVRWINAPSVKRPGKKASKEQLEEYKILTKTQNLSTLTMRNVQALRDELDQLELRKKILIIVGDGSFCNRICFSTPVERTIMVARCRRDAKLCYQAQEGARRFYSKETFTPEDVRKDESIPWKTGNFFFGGTWRELKYKEVKNVFWRSGAKRKPLRLIVMAPTPYWKGGKKNYRDPAYLLVTDNEAPVEVLIQAYLDRWQMEYCHRDAKSILGVGEAQVRNENSVVRQPAFHIATYSALILAGIIAYGDRPHSDFGERPGWRKPPRRLTLRALIGMLRGCLEDNPDVLKEYGIEVERAGAAMRQAA
jgi:hypothetical protein